MGCKWCGVDLDWRAENGKNVPYDVTDPKYQKRHQCPKDPRNAPKQNAPAAATSSTTSSPSSTKPIPPPSRPLSDIVIVGNLSDQVKNQIRAIVSEEVEKTFSRVGTEIKKAFKEAFGA